VNPFEQLDGYLRSLETRLRWGALTRGLAYAAIAALAATVLLVFLANRFSFAEPAVQVSRFFLFVALGLAVSLGLIVPLLRINRRRTARRAEQAFPEFSERLVTFAENRNPRDPFVELLAEETVPVAQTAAATARQRSLALRRVIGRHHRGFHAGLVDSFRSRLSWTRRFAAMGRYAACGNAGIL